MSMFSEWMLLSGYLLSVSSECVSSEPVSSVLVFGACLWRYRKGREVFLSDEALVSRLIKFDMSAYYGHHSAVYIT